MGKVRSNPASIKPSLRNLEWAAGFLEGEGSFRNCNKHPCEQISADQVQLEPLQKLQNLFGGSIGKPSKQKSNQQPLSKWTISGTRARGVMLTLYALMSSRRKLQIREALLVRK